jgi:hypothetical protein
MPGHKFAVLRQVGRQPVLDRQGGAPNRLVLPMKVCDRSPAGLGIVAKPRHRELALLCKRRCVRSAQIDNSLELITLIG